MVVKRSVPVPNLGRKQAEAKAEEEGEVGVQLDELVSAVKTSRQLPKGTAVKPAEDVLKDEKAIVTGPFSPMGSVGPMGTVAAPSSIETEREVPVEVTSLPAGLATRTYATSEVFQFFLDAALQDKLKINDKGAARWLAPGAPFPIPDPESPSDIYPSVEHYIAGQRINLASNKPEMAVAIFGSNGDYHQKYIRESLELTQGGTKKLSEDNDFKLLKAEVAEIKDAQKPAALRKLGIVVDEAKFTASKNKVIRDALRVRLEKDARFRKIVDAVRSQGKILLYYTGASAASELGGYRGADEKLYGENKIGRFIMELAGGFPA